MATRWGMILDALGVSEESFDLEHASKFDLDPRGWLRERIEEIEVVEDVAATLEDEKCTKPCCVEVR